MRMQSNFSLNNQKPEEKKGSFAAKDNEPEVEFLRFDSFAVAGSQ